MQFLRRCRGFLRTIVTLVLEKNMQRLKPQQLNREKTLVHCLFVASSRIIGLLYREEKTKLLIEVNLLSFLKTIIKKFVISVSPLARLQLSSVPELWAGDSPAHPHLSVSCEVRVLLGNAPVVSPGVSPRVLPSDYLL